MLRKRLKKYLCFLSAVVIAFSSFVINSSAAQTESNTYKISMARPSTGSSTGYAEVLLEGTNGDRFVRVFSWNIYSSSYLYNPSSSQEDFEYLDLPMSITVNSQSIKFEFAYTLDVSSPDYFGLNATILSFSSLQSYNLQQLDGFGASWTYSSSGYSIISVHLYGNYRATESVGNTEFYVLYSDEVVQYNQFLKVIQIINQLASNDETIISKLQSIINNIDTIESKLSSVIDLLTSIKSELSDVNKELDNIEANTDNLEKYTDELESKLDTIIGILNNKNQSTPKPDTSTTDDYASKEEALIGGTAAGREEANTVFTDFNSTMSDNVGRGLLAVTAIFKEFTNISWLDSLIKFSLALGVFGFILGMGFFLVSSSANREARSERKQVNKLRSDYYKSGAEYYKSRSDK